MILQQDQPSDSVLVNNQTTTMRGFGWIAFGHTGLEIEFHGEGVEDKGVDSRSGAVLVEVSPNYFRPTEVDSLVGDYPPGKGSIGLRTQNQGGGALPDYGGDRSRSRTV